MSKQYCQQKLSFEKQGSSIYFSISKIEFLFSDKNGYIILEALLCSTIVAY